jgi:hypothetical protein
MGTWSADSAARWLYRGGRPNPLARLINRLGATAFAAGARPGQWVTLEIVGRRTGRPISFPMVMAEYDGSRYFVSMLGESTNWVRNLRAADHRATVVHGRREAVRLVEVDPAVRGPILRVYLAVAPGARPHIPVELNAPDEVFAEAAQHIPVYRVEADQQ